METSLNMFSVNGLYRHFTMIDTFNLDILTNNVSLLKGYSMKEHLYFKAALLNIGAPL